MRGNGRCSEFLSLILCLLGQERVNIRWIGHTIEYFALGLAAGAMFKRKWIALPVCLLISVIDQLTKIFIPVRHFDPEDIPFDIVGFCCGIAIAWVISLAVRVLKKTKL